MTAGAIRERVPSGARLSIGQHSAVRPHSRRRSFSNLDFRARLDSLASPIPRMIRKLSIFRRASAGFISPPSLGSTERDDISLRGIGMIVLPDIAGKPIPTRTPCFQREEIGAPETPPIFNELVWSLDDSDPFFIRDCVRGKPCYDAIPGRRAPSGFPLGASSQVHTVL